MSGKKGFTFDTGTDTTTSTDTVASPTTEESLAGNLYIFGRSIWFQIKFIFHIMIPFLHSDIFWFDEAATSYHNSIIVGRNAIKELSKIFLPHTVGYTGIGRNAHAVIKSWRLGSHVVQICVLVPNLVGICKRFNFQEFWLYIIWLWGQKRKKKKMENWKW